MAWRWKYSPKEQLEDMSSQHPGLTGLQNLENTCYMNAVLQCLCSLTPLVQYFLSGRWNTALHEETGESATAFGCLISDMWLGEFDYVSPEAFHSVFGKRYPAFSRRTQHDAQEFLICVLDDLHEAFKEDCLECFFQPDTLTRNNQIHCYWCGGNQDATVKASITKAPQIIIFHLKRFAWQDKHRRKLSTTVCYPFRDLDLSPYSTVSCNKAEYSLCAVVVSFAFPAFIGNALPHGADEACVGLDFMYDLYFNMCFVVCLFLPAMDIVQYQYVTKGERSNFPFFPNIPILKECTPGT
ncbi:PREDICTED: inactive ubiquitin carboxyl-terminal hydrolase 50 isoform X1 [Corvus brachyrhynchos]|uniref:inactive ubiquitin carboxyl-terminal hydrolase 50 isoform X1 n=1 Tax=Corvus brachyrhynchos TaxID=85066 RepID=UPI0008164DBE|nr:PREDICTED: inactive ubiquitin carboxyl-terminal hydrolase 50 isoform X1 [Corvus brachyrhynchos]